MHRVLLIVGGLVAASAAAWLAVGGAPADPCGGDTDAVPCLLERSKAAVSQYEGYPEAIPILAAQAVVAEALGRTADADTLFANVETRVARFTPRDRGDKVWALALALDAAGRTDAARRALAAYADDFAAAEGTAVCLNFDAVVRQLQHVGGGTEARDVTARAVAHVARLPPSENAIVERLCVVGVAAKAGDEAAAAHLFDETAATADKLESRSVPDRARLTYAMLIAADRHGWTERRALLDAELRTLLVEGASMFSPYDLGQSYLLYRLRRDLPGGWPLEFGVDDEKTEADCAVSPDRTCVAVHWRALVGAPEAHGEPGTILPAVAEWLARQGSPDADKVFDRAQTVALAQARPRHRAAALSRVAEAQHRSARHDAARATLHEAVKVIEGADWSHADTVDMLLSLAALQAEAGAEDRALDTLNRVFSPASEDCADEVCADRAIKAAAVTRKLGRHHDAKARLASTAQALIAAMPGTSGPLLRVAQAEVAAGRGEEAAANLRHALTVAETSDVAYAVLDEARLSIALALVKSGRPLAVFHPHIELRRLYGG